MKRFVQISKQNLKKDVAGAITDTYFKKLFRKVFTEKMRKYNKRKSSMVIDLFLLFYFTPYSLETN